MSRPQWVEDYERKMAAAREEIERMSPEERAALERAARNAEKKMQSSFDPTFKNVTPPPTAK